MKGQNYTTHLIIHTTGNKSETVREVRSQYKAYVIMMYFKMVYHELLLISRD